MVKDNVFRLDATKVPLCARSTGCGFNGLFSNFGSYPAWSPYKADVVAKNITFEHNNHWRSNAFVGDWHFQAGEIGNIVDWDAWRSSPYKQDEGSTVN